MALKRSCTLGFIKDMRERLRISHNKSDHEINDLVNAALRELRLAGVPQAIIEKFIKEENDPLIKQAVTVYLKAEFGFDAPDADKYREAFERLKIKITLAEEYLKGG